MMEFTVVYLLFLICVCYLPGYILKGIGLFSIAKRRGIDHPWMAWVPGLELYLLGCVSDQYQAMVRGKNKNKRTALLLLLLAELIVSGVMLTLPMSVETGNMLPFLLTVLPLWGAGIAMTVIAFLALYDVYVSCDPKNAVVFLVLSIVLSVTQPLFLFLCRKKDLGFPL